MLTWWLILLLLVYFGVILMLVGIILIQSGKGGGLSSLAQSSGGIGDALGATGAEKALNRMTTYLAVAFIIMAIGISLISSARSGKRSAAEILGESATPSANTTTNNVPPPVPAGEALPGATAPVAPSEDVLNALPSGPPTEAAPMAPGEVPAAVPAPAPATDAAPAAESAPVEAAPVEPAPAEQPATP